MLKRESRVQAQKNIFNNYYIYIEHQKSVY